MQMIRDLELQKAQARACVDQELLEEYEMKKSMAIEVVYFNSNQRLLNAAKIMEAVSGVTQDQYEYQGTDPCSTWR